MKCVLLKQRYKYNSPKYLPKLANHGHEPFTLARCRGYPAPTRRCVSGLGRQERNARELTIGRMQHMSILPMSAQIALKSVTLVGDAGAKQLSVALGRGC